MYMQIAYCNLRKLIYHIELAVSIIVQKLSAVSIIVQKLSRRCPGVVQELPVSKLYDPRAKSKNPSDILPV
jgi:hypothetical protein